jgi:hypothetical protein
MQPSVITDHRLLDHDFDWENVRVLDEEPILGKKLLFEMLFIKRQINGLNSQNDTERLQHAYATITQVDIKRATWMRCIISRRFLVAESESGSEIFLSRQVFEKIEVKSAKKKRVFGHF